MLREQIKVPPPLLIVKGKRKRDFKKKGETEKMNSQKERSQTKKPTSNVVAPLSLTKQELVITTVSFLTLPHSMI